MPSTRSEWIKSAPRTATSEKANTPLFPFLVKLLHGEDLTPKEAAAFFRAMTSGESGSNQVAAALTALTAKGETAEELAGMASVLKELATKIRAPKTAMDIVGTGSSAAKTFNVSTAAAIVAAGAGLTIAKQSNRGVTSKTGSADVLAELGVKIANDPTMAQTSLNTGVCFLSPPKFHPEMRRLADIRGRLGIRTCLNILGLLANPAGVSRHLIGVWHGTLVMPTAKALALLKTDTAWVVHGEDGMDEVSLSGKTHVATVKNGEVRSYMVTPKDFGMNAGATSHLNAATAKESAVIIRDVLASKRRDEARSLVVLNAATALIIGGIAKDPMQAARLAEQSIDSGQAQNKLDRLVQFTNKKSSEPK
ncbi:MAG: anthranilate phosphoribosyltransferase [Pyrinomonadaceae bacterium]